MLTGFEVQNGVIGQAGVHVRELAQSGGDHLGKQIVVTWSEPPFLFDALFQALAHLHKLGGVDFDDQGDAGCGMHAHRHAFGDDSPHAG